MYVCVFVALSHIHHYHKAELELPNFRSYDLGSLRTGIMGERAVHPAILAICSYEFCFAAGSPCPMEIMRKVAFIRTHSCMNAQKY